MCRVHALILGVPRTPLILSGSESPTNGKRSSQLYLPSEISDEDNMCESLLTSI